MSEDYKKIALEDVKKGQRVRIVYRYTSHTATYEGVVAGLTVTPDMFDDSDVWDGIDLGSEDDMVSFAICPGPDSYTDIFLLEDVPKPKVVRTETVTITHYDDGTKTETPVKDGLVPMVIKTLDQFAACEDYLKKLVLRDTDGDYWMYRDGNWCWKSRMLPTEGGVWNISASMDVLNGSLPMTIVENVGD